MIQQARLRKIPHVLFLTASVVLPTACTTLAPTSPYERAPVQGVRRETGLLESPSSFPGEDAKASRDATDISPGPGPSPSVQKGPVTLQKCIAVALRNSPELLAAEAEAGAAQAERRRLRLPAKPGGGFDSDVLLHGFRVLFQIVVDLARHSEYIPLPR